MLQRILLNVGLVTVSFGAGVYTAQNYDVSMDAAKKFYHQNVQVVKSDASKSDASKSEKSS